LMLMACPSSWRALAISKVSKAGDGWAEPGHDGEAGVGVEPVILSVNAATLFGGRSNDPGSDAVITAAGCHHVRLTGATLSQPIAAARSVLVVQPARCGV